jgi:hypothetical protein
LDRVLEVDEEGQVGNAAVIVSFLTEYLEAGAGECGLVEGLGRADLMKVRCFFVIVSMMRYRNYKKN